MRSVVQLKSLGDIRTTISTHGRSTPRHKGTTYLEILSLGMEKQRLQAEMAVLYKRQRRIEVRLVEIRDAMAKLLGKVEEDRTSTGGDETPGQESLAPKPSVRPSRCKQVTVRY